MLKERCHAPLLDLSDLHAWPKMPCPSFEDLMLTLIYRNILDHACLLTVRVCLFVVLVWLSGCTGLDQYVPSAQPQLTPAQEARVGAAVEAKLIQLLGAKKRFLPCE